MSVHVPTFVPMYVHRQLERENARLVARIAELENRPLIALAPDERVQELEAELARTKRLLTAVRELLKKGGGTREVGLRD